jgi:hypothetical protein
MIESKGLTSAASDLSPLIVSASGSRSLLTPTSVPRTTNGSNSVSATSWASASLADPWAKDSRGQRWRSRHLRKRYRCLVGRQWFAPLKCRRTRSNRCGVDFTRIYQFAFSSWFWFIPELRDDRQTRSRLHRWCWVDRRPCALLDSRIGDLVSPPCGLYSKAQRWCVPQKATANLRNRPTKLLKLKYGNSNTRTYRWDFNDWCWLRATGYICDYCNHRVQNS